ncbi:MAG: Gfo/Idh/MocA family oxidoreductase [Deltaproteobacteria bacterium]|nr:Gfo/Idh/MocA family oxidoreductase [Deltaproteobacteria bacterium]MBZ0219242.1 Gfo/Idh/MocA family oxidoreductase [Deltaproteobacteria bacterium]
MGKSLKTLVVGCGSIGKRHIKNLASLGVRDFILCDTNTATLERAVRGLERPIMTTSFNDALAKLPDAAVICTPSSMHLDMALQLARRGVHILIEKPLSDKLDGVTELARLVEEKGITAMMAMCYRFHPVFLQIESLLASEVIGKVHHVNYYGGHYLPDWHPQADYRTEYAARKELGGGVVLTSIHGLDNIRWLFGEVDEVFAFVDRVSGLEMDVEDIVTGVMRLKSGAYVNWQTDFIQRANQHRLVVAGSRGTIRADLLDGTVETYSAELGKWYSGRIGFEVNEMYMAESRHFLECIERGLTPRAGVRDGIATLELALRVKGSRNLVEGREARCKTA